MSVRRIIVLFLSNRYALILKTSNCEFNILKMSLFLNKICLFLFQKNGLFNHKNQRKSTNTVLLWHDWIYILQRIKKIKKNQKIVHVLICVPNPNSPSLVCYQGFLSPSYTDEPSTLKPGKIATNFKVLLLLWLLIS